MKMRLCIECEYYKTLGFSSWAKQSMVQMIKLFRIGEDTRSKGYVIDGLENKLRFYLCVVFFCLSLGGRKKGNP